MVSVRRPRRVGVMVRVRVSVRGKVRGEGCVSPHRKVIGSLQQKILKLV